MDWGERLMYEYKIGLCYICNQGWILISKTDDKQFFCHCEECESTWDSPQDFFKHRISKNDKLQFSAINIQDDDVLPDDWLKYVI